VAASVRLQARQLWRRNRQGDLSRPGFWPKDLAPLFWPLALALAGGLLALLVVGGTKVWAPGPADVAPVGVSSGGVAPAADVAPGEAILGFDAPRLAEPLAPESLVAESLSEFGFVFRLAWSASSSMTRTFIEERSTLPSSVANFLITEAFFIKVINTVLFLARESETKVEVLPAFISGIDCQK
jgi:hypothetical protein